MKHAILPLLCLTLAGCQPNASIEPQSPIDQLVAGIALTSFPDRVINFDLQVSNRNPECTPLSALQHAIDSCSLLGGGMVNVAPGEYLLGGPLNLKSNVNLHLQEGACLKFSGRADDFLPVVLTRFEGTELYGHSPMVYAQHQYNVAITGQGVIDGQAGIEMAAWGYDGVTEGGGNALHGEPGVRPEVPFVNQLRQMGEELTPLPQRIFAEGTKLRPTCVELLGCSRVLLEGITIKDSPFWTIHPLYCDNVIVRGVTIDSHFPNNDGCDPESSSNVLIEDCLFRCGDDAVAIKSGRDADGRRVGRPSENIVVRRCDFQSECNGLCIGSEMSGGVQNVWMDSIKIGTVKNALYFKSNRDRGGFIRGIHVSNVTIEKAFGAILRFETNYFGYHGGNYQAQYEDFDISHVHAGEAEGYAIFYDGNDEKPIRRIAVDDFHVGQAPHPWYLYRTEDCTFTHSTVAGQPIPEHPDESPERQTCDVW